jgi:hypothetical protein
MAAGTIAATILVIYILLVVFKATPSNDVVKGFRHVATPLAWIFKGLFTPHNPRAKVAVNYGVAAVVYFAVARIVVRVLGVGTGD